MYYNKTYHISDYLNTQDMNDLANNVRNELFIASDEIGINTSAYPFWSYKDWADWEAHPTLDPHFFSYDDFITIEQMIAIEGSIMQLGYDFMQPPGYIQNKIWRDWYETDVYKSFGAEDLNRIITDMNLLFEYIEKWYIGEYRVPIYNLYSDENWDGETTLEWE